MNYGINFADIRTVEDIRRAIDDAHDVYDLYRLADLIHDMRQGEQALFVKVYKDLRAAQVLNDSLKKVEAKFTDLDALQNLASHYDALYRICVTTDQLWRIAVIKLTDKAYTICGDDHESITCIIRRARVDGLDAVIDNFDLFLWRIQQGINLPQD